MNTIDINTVISDGDKNYTIENLLGSGGFADVYKATCGGRAYAVKVLRNSDPKHVTSLKNEFEIASKVDSEHAVKYYYLNDYSHNNWPCFIIMEYVDGGSLEDELQYRISAGSPYMTNELLDIYGQLISGMKDISKIAVHRDIKPHNILKTSAGIYKISDYGLAKFQDEATRSASKTMKGYGSEKYYAPELWADPMAKGINDGKVDIYAMGIVFYQLANLNYPYENMGDPRVMHMTSAIRPFNRDVDPVLQSLIRKMMEKPKAKRFDSWEQIELFLVNSSLGKGVKRAAFVESMLKDTAAKKHALCEKEAKENKKEQERIEAFRRLVSQVESEIYDPLKQIVEEYNNDSMDRKAKLTEIIIENDEEACEFEYSIEPINDKYERTIRFFFQAPNTETIKSTNALSILTSGYHDENPLDLDGVMNCNQRNSVTEYKYLRKKILFWGVVKADCGAGINIAILEDPDDKLYGKIKTFIRTPNLQGCGFWLPIESKDMLKKLCNMEFRELHYTMKVEDFDFCVVEQLIKLNEASKYDSIKDPFERNIRIPIV